MRSEARDDLPVVFNGNGPAKSGVEDETICLSGSWEFPTCWPEDCIGNRNIRTPIPATNSCWTRSFVAAAVVVVH